MHLTPDEQALRHVNAPAERRRPQSPEEGARRRQHRQRQRQDDRRARRALPRLGPRPPTSACCSSSRAPTSNYGENTAAKKIGMEIISLGGGFTWLSKDIEKDKALARELWEQCKAKIASGDYDVVALDEFTYPLTYGWLPTNEVVEFLKKRPPRTHVIITGRDAPQELIDYADLVTEMREIKHPFQQGLKAQPGIEF